MQVHNKKSLIEIRRLLRRNMTDAEFLLWNRLRNKKLDNLKFNRQHSIGNYIVDFYCASKKLIIEIDGGIHLDKEVQRNDRERDQVLMEMDYTILRFANDEVFDDMEKLMSTIRRIAIQKSYSFNKKNEKK